MTNYAHGLGFGLEVLGVAAAPGDTVALAALAEELGYDFVVLPDRVEEGGAEALTLAAWTAARTTTVQVAAS